MGDLSMMAISRIHAVHGQFSAVLASEVKTLRTESMLYFNNQSVRL